MNRRSLLLLPLALLPVPALAQPRAAALSPQDRADVARIEAYLNTLRSLRARFLQVAPDGGTSQGQAWLVRPGRMRFQYDPPSPFLLVGGNGLLVFNDSQLKQTSNIPLGSTPLGLLLQDNLRLSGEITIVSFVEAARPDPGRRRPHRLPPGRHPHPHLRRRPPGAPPMDRARRPAPRDPHHPQQRGAGRLLLRQALRVRRPPLLPEQPGRLDRRCGRAPLEGIVTA